MRRELLVGVGVLCFLLTDVLVGQSAIAIRAAATSPVSGWQQMPSPDRVGVLWVAPADALTSEDIARAEQVVDSNGFPALTMVFTDEGAKKMSALSTNRIGQPIALLLDGKLIWAPVVRARMEREAVLNGGPEGLTADAIQRLLAILKQR